MTNFLKNHYLLSVLFVLYCLHLGIKFAKYPVPLWVSSYFADILCLPILLSFIVIFLRKFRQEHDFQLKKSMILFVFLYVSFVFEIVLPTFSNRYTSDIYDVMMYALGGLSYGYFNRK